MGAAAAATGKHASAATTTMTGMTALRKRESPKYTASPPFVFYRWLNGRRCVVVAELAS